jgi:SAM-dependent methyltransferase/GNAT superfamily N-acetyltransferase
LAVGQLPNENSQPVLWRLHWRTLRGERARSEPGLLARCAALYSSSYGIWGSRGKRPGERIKRTAADVAELLASPDSFVAVAEMPNGEIVGYCVAVYAEAPEAEGRIAWVSQLVVGEAFRNEGIATNLLYSIWQFSDRYAWGMVSASPYAIRALESATRRTCRLSEIRKHGNNVLRQLRGHVSYLPECLEEEDGLLRAVVNTEFFVSHKNLEVERRRAAREKRPWPLGDIEEGEEWFGCTFASQTPMPLPPQKLEEILVGADRVWMDAFARMTLDESHRWRAYSENEVAFIQKRLGLKAGASILDIGCGDGRHVAAFARAGIQGEGVDAVTELIQKAREAHGDLPLMKLTVADGREPIKGPEVDAVLLLYDVLGASANRGDDLRLLRSATARARKGGNLVLSVMNAGVTAGKIPDAQQPKTDLEFLQALERLPPSNTMEESGDIFNPGLLLEYDGIYYRKEQFLQMEDFLPSEHVVRDLRYSTASLTELLEEAGLVIEEIIPVQAGNWDRRPALPEDDPRAKELLSVARIP